MTNTYDSAGRLVETRDARGSSTSFVLDALDRTVRTVDALDHASETSFDDAVSAEEQGEGFRWLPLDDEWDLPPWSYFAGVLVHETVHALNLGPEPQAKDLARLFRLELGYGSE